MTEVAANEVCAVIVTYRPEPAKLLRLVDQVKLQVGAIAVIDNASAGTWQFPLRASLSMRGSTLLCQSQNVGLAAAQNIGIDWARANGYRYVLLLDQDSEPCAGMVDTLVRALRTLACEHPVAAVGPRFHDEREHCTAPFVRVGFPFNRKQWCDASTMTISCDFLISSGSLIPLAVIDQVGPMDTGLFIDNVDMEWSFRARAQGFALHGVCAATMHHHLGDARWSLPFGVTPVVVHGSVRLYYMMRNRLLLYRMAHTPGVWIAQDVPRVLAKLFLFGFLIGPRMRNLRCMLRGLWDGLRGHRGVGPYVASPVDGKLA
jgi:rhamnosyltransferase